jgi:hypothetical protein
MTSSDRRSCCGGFPLSFLILLFSGTCLAWDTPPHQLITKAALDTLPKSLLSRLGSEVKPLIDIYCILPDRYEEMEHFGFVRSSPGPRHTSEIRIYCVRPDGQLIHGATGDRDGDTDSLIYLLERSITKLCERRSGEAARYLGVLSHFIADSLSPPHAVGVDELREMTPRSIQLQAINVHSALERSIPEFTLGPRLPRVASGHIQTAAANILDQIYAGAELNRRDLVRMVKALVAHDEQTVNSYRLRAGKNAAEILADALYSVFRIAEADE